MPIEIREHIPGEDIDDFIRAGNVVFAGDPAWVPPLDMDIRGRLTPAKNPFYEHADVGLWTAWRDGRLVGRTSASIDHEHLRIHDDATGFFGFFDTLDDEEAAAALIDAARTWLRKRGMKRMRGPLSLSMNEEVGTLIEGFEDPPMFLMAHSRSWQGDVADAIGLEKAKDIYAWRFDVGKLPKRAVRAWESVKEMPEVRLRTVNTDDWDRELDTIMDIFNDAWSENWGWVPATDAEKKKTGNDLKMILDKEIAFVAEVNDRPAAICIALPNVNEVVRDFDGKMGPVNLMKMLWRLKVSRPKSARLMLLGISDDVRGIRKYGRLSHALYVEIAKRGEASGYRWGELSWTLEDNAPVNLGIRSMGAKIYKTYRIYEVSTDQPT